MDEAFELIAQEFSATIIEEANARQITIDAFIRRQGARLSQADFQRLITTETSTLLREVDAMKNAIRSALSDAITGIAQEAYDIRTRRFIAEDEKLRWQTESGRPCPDCVNRSGWEPRTYAEWEAVGLPKYGATVCGNRCMCVLVR